MIIDLTAIREAPAPSNLPPFARQRNTYRRSSVSRVDKMSPPLVWCAYTTSSGPGFDNPHIRQDARALR